MARPSLAEICLTAAADRPVRASMALRLRLCSHALCIEEWPCAHVRPGRYSLGRLPNRPIGTAACQTACAPHTPIVLRNGQLFAAVATWPTFPAANPAHLHHSASDCGCALPLLRTTVVAFAAVPCRPGASSCSILQVASASVCWPHAHQPTLLDTASALMLPWSTLQQRCGSCRAASPSIARRAMHHSTAPVDPLITMALRIHARQKAQRQAARVQRARAGLSGQDADKENTVDSFVTNSKPDNLTDSACLGGSCGPRFQNISG